MRIRRRNNRSLPALVIERATHGKKVSGRFQRERHVTADLIDRLGLSQELEGHTSCVNCLEWNRSGELLASGSDDKTVILWSGETGKKLVQLATDHSGNIFSVKFLPDSGDRALVTGAQDARICLLDVPRETVVQSAAFHFGRVKRLAVALDTPGLFWSAAEDGLVMQWDTRERWQPNEANVLVNLVKHTGQKAEVKCIAVCPLRPELLAIGANDPYVRIYDRRMLRLQKAVEGEETGTRLSNWDRRAKLAPTEGTGDETPVGAVSYFVPGHLPGIPERHRLSRPLTSTYLAFSPSGTDLIVNLGSEQIYIYDKFALFHEQLPSSWEQLAVMEKKTACDKSAMKEEGDGIERNGQCRGPAHVFSSRMPAMPEHVERIKLEANVEFDKGNYSAAIRHYNRALLRCPHPTLYGNRAAAFMKRGWSGDTYAALRDCMAALALEDRHVKAHLRLVRCLMDLQHNADATRWLDLFRVRFPEQIRSQAYSKIEKDLKAATEKEEKEKKEKEEAAEESQARTTSNSENSSGSSNSSNAPLGTRYGPEFFRRGNQEEAVEGQLEEESGPEEEILISPVSERSRRISAQEQIWRGLARDFTSRFVGTCNTTTDIKEANFFGNDAQYVVAGSDDGKFFIWDRETTNIVKVLVGDDSIVNCLQGHPTAPILATSGIDPVVRIWQPMPENGAEDPRNVQDFESVVKTNQRSMDVDPLEMFIRINHMELPTEGHGIQCTQS